MPSMKGIWGREYGIIIIIFQIKKFGQILEVRCINFVFKVTSTMLQ